VDLTNTTARALGGVLDRAGIKWEYDADGDIKVQHRLPRPPWVDLVFYEIAPDWSIRGQFLNARATPRAEGGVYFERPTDGSETTGPAAKVVDVYFMPELGGVGMQVHATIAPLGLARPFQIAIMPTRQQVSRIETSFPRYVGVGEGGQFFMKSGVTGSDLPEAAFVSALREGLEVGLEMFKGPFTGSAFRTSE
jgi:hypothetical protein